MRPTEKHFEMSLERTGKDYADLHRWIDAAEHKNERHDFTRIWDFSPQITTQYGEEGVKEYIEHLREDMEKKFKKIRHKYKAAMHEAQGYFGSKHREE
ncbi:MAG: acetoacetate--CoA ligase family protein [Desulfobulbaceae bacterium]|nr:acetoacetate--CoA ligase family protein [Desulfobulbaceae bacterium]